jgi:hypothetical protein
MVRQLNITISYGVTEASDETAYGDWMKLVATMGLQWDKAYSTCSTDITSWSGKGPHFFEGASMSLDRPRPPQPEQARETTTQQGVRHEGTKNQPRRARRLRRGGTTTRHHDSTGM